MGIFSVSKRFGRFVAVDHVSLQRRKGMCDTTSRFDVSARP
jgi:hypothetical protein